MGPSHGPSEHRRAIDAKPLVRRWRAAVRRISGDILASRQFECCLVRRTTSDLACVLVVDEPLDPAALASVVPPPPDLCVIENLPANATG